MDNEIKNDLVKYRIEKAKETLNTAEKILEDIKDYSERFHKHNTQEKIVIMMMNLFQLMKKQKSN